MRGYTQTHFPLESIRLKNRAKNLLLKIIDIIFLVRLPLLVPVWTIVMLGWISGSDSAVIGGSFVNKSGGYVGLWQALLFFSLIVASIYIVNQIMDVESDRLNNKLFILPQGLISLPVAWGISIICATFGIIGAALYFDLTMVVIFLSGLIMGVLYNLPPVLLKDRAWGGVIANLIGHGLITFCVGWYAANFEKGGSLTLILKAVSFSLSAGFANAAVYLTTTIPDSEGDSKVGKKTFAVVYGEKITSIAAALSCALALVGALFLEYNSWVMVTTAAISLLLFIRFIFQDDKKKAFQTFRWPVAILSIMVAFFVPLYLGLVAVTVVSARIYYKMRFNYDYPKFSEE